MAGRPGGGAGRGGGAGSAGLEQELRLCTAGERSFRLSAAYRSLRAPALVYVAEEDRCGGIFLPPLPALAWRPGVA